MKSTKDKFKKVGLRKSREGRVFVFVVCSVKSFSFVIYNDSILVLSFSFI